jgi:hypothetical protein
MGASGLWNPLMSTRSGFGFGGLNTPMGGWSNLATLFGCHPSTLGGVSPLSGFGSGIGSNWMTSSIPSSLGALTHPRGFPGLGHFGAGNINTLGSTHVSPVQAQNLIHGLTVDGLKRLKTHKCIEAAVDLLRGNRSIDQVWLALLSGAPINPQLIAHCIQNDRFVDARVADLVEMLLCFTLRDSEGIKIAENLICGAAYPGPTPNQLEREALFMKGQLVKNELANLYAMTGRA